MARMRALLLSLLLTSTSLAQTPGVIFHSAADIAQAQALTLDEARHAANGQGSHPLDTQEASAMLVLVRVRTGEAEVHQFWADQMIMQSGTMTVVTGGSIVGRHPYGTNPGEFRGTAIEGGTEHILHPGDLLRVPAGVPHWTRLAPGTTVRYLAVKERLPSPPPTPTPR